MQDRIPLSVAMADLNRDGKTDLVFENDTASVNVLIGNGDGTFQPPITYSSGGYASSATVADVNSDGKLDIIATNQCADAGCQYGSIEILMGNGDGTFPGVLGQAATPQSYKEI